MIQITSNTLSKHTDSTGIVNLYGLIKAYKL